MGDHIVACSHDAHSSRLGCSGCGGGCLPPAFAAPDTFSAAAFRIAWLSARRTSPSSVALPAEARSAAAALASSTANVVTMWISVRSLCCVASRPPPCRRISRPPRESLQLQRRLELRAVLAAAAATAPGDAARGTYARVPLNAAADGRNRRARLGEPAGGISCPACGFACVTRAHIESCVLTGVRKAVAGFVAKRKHKAVR